MSITGTAWDKAEWEKCHSWRDSPFDLAAPYEWVVGLEREGKIYGHVLDLGCGAGHNGIFLAGQGYRVTGVDLSSTAIERARQKASERGVQAEFVTGNACELGGYEANFDTVIDIGCFHSLREENQAAYAAAVHRACRPGARIHLRAFSEYRPAQEVLMDGKAFRAPSVSEDQLRKAFSQGWAITSLERREIELGELTITGRGEHRADVWFAQVERQ